ncbi:glycosyltransferase [Mycobacterium lehmannii]|uniref:glycosyltransferase n=1 Tax=Mycobacterium lehmannii TaxID=2048550 RepID=UPI000B93E130|nr:glycosyltransferase [Mycobacterium lehmannii]
MKFALACYGTRGDVEPSAAVARELLARGHEVRMAVPRELIAFVEGAGIEAVPYGPPMKDFLDDEFLRNFWTGFARNPARLLRDLWKPIIRYWEEVSTTLVSVAEGVDLLSSGINFEQPVANVAEHYDIPFVTLHDFPMRPNGKLLPNLPSVLVRNVGKLTEWLFWRSTKKVENHQRRLLNLPEAKRPAPQRFLERGSLEIQGYDEACFPGLAAEWAKWRRQRPFVGTLTLALPTDADDEIASWIAAGTPPVFFAPGSIPVESPAEIVELISSACADLGERALICSFGTDFSDAPRFENVKVADTVNFGTVFPACRGAVHHGGSGTTAAVLRAGLPSLVLWNSGQQRYWAAQVQELKVGVSRHFSATTRNTLVSDLNRVLDPECIRRAAELAARMTDPSKSVAQAADLFEDAVRRHKIE